MPRGQNIPTQFDVIILGAGAAGLFCGARVGQGGKRVLVIDHSAKPAEKVRISGGGRCNFTNLHTDPESFISANPHFAKSALSRYTPYDFLDLLATHKISWHEKKLGQLFCDGKSSAIIQMLLDELSAAGGELRLATEVSGVSKTESGFAVDTGAGRLTCSQLVIATGGLSIPKMGATGFAYELAERYGHRLIDPRPALVPFVFTDDQKTRFADLAGVACDVRAKANGTSFDEAMLFTHRGLSGPAILQISSYWTMGTPISVDLFSGVSAYLALVDRKDSHPKQTLSQALEQDIPKRLAALVVSDLDLAPDVRLADMPNRSLEQVAKCLNEWQLQPAGTEGWRTAEVTAGGINTDDLSSKTMESRHADGLYFIGECVDVTGWLGGYNFQWAWASAYAAAEAIRARVT